MNTNHTIYTTKPIYYYDNSTANTGEYITDITNIETSYKSPQYVVYQDDLQESYFMKSFAKRLERLVSRIKYMKK